MSTMQTKVVKTRDFLKYILARPIYVLVFLMVTLSLLFVPNFATVMNIRNALVQSCDLLILACGMTFVIMNGGIDFSISAVMSFASVLGASIMTSGGPLGGYWWGFLPAMLAMLLVGVFVGCINGFAVTKLKMPSFMTTMALQLVFNGLAMGYTTSSSITDLPQSFLKIGNGRVGFVPVPVLIAAAVILCSAWILQKTSFGKSIFAVGSSQKVANISGVKIKSVIFRLFVINGVLAALAGIIVTARIGAGKPDIGNTSVLDVITAVAIGGTSLSGGSGSIWGTTAGALFITILNVSMGLMNVKPMYILITKGSILMALALYDALRQRAALR